MTIWSASHLPYYFWKVALTPQQYCGTFSLLFNLLLPHPATAHDNSFKKTETIREGSSFIFLSIKLPAFVPLFSFPPASGMKCPFS